MTTDHDPVLDAGPADRLFISDPGHGWLRVPLDDVESSGFKPSEFSFIGNGYAYLEEDCDAPGFIDATGESFTGIPSRYVEEFRRPAQRFPG